jgi:hypothetical protein
MTNEETNAPERATANFARCVTSFRKLSTEELLSPIATDDGKVVFFEHARVARNRVLAERRRDRQ